MSIQIFETLASSGKEQEELPSVAKKLSSHTGSQAISTYKATNVPMVISLEGESNLKYGVDQGRFNDLEISRAVRLRPPYYIGHVTSASISKFSLLVLNILWMTV